jgi:hypothetical protein
VVGQLSLFAAEVVEDSTPMSHECPPVAAG